MQSNSSDFWDKKHDKYAGQDWTVKPTIFAEQVIRYLPKTGKILELGCGQAADTIYFAQKGYQVMANDFSPKAIEYAKSRIPEELQKFVELSVFDLNNSLSYDNEFDVIYSHLSLHFFSKEKTQELFDEIYRALKPSGIFATILNSIHDPEVETFQKIDEDYYLDPDGQTKRYFSVASLTQYVKKFETIVLDDEGETWKDRAKGVHNLVRFIGKKI